MLRYAEGISDALNHFGNDKEAFYRDKVFRNAVAMPMLQIGELAKDLKDDIPEIVVRIRDILENEDKLLTSTNFKPQPAGRH